MPKCVSLVEPLKPANLITSCNIYTCVSNILTAAVIAGAMRHKTSVCSMGFSSYLSPVYFEAVHSFDDEKVSVGINLTIILKREEASFEPSFHLNTALLAYQLKSSMAT